MHGCNAIFSPWYSSSCKVPMLIRLLSEPEPVSADSTNALRDHRAQKDPPQNWLVFLEDGVAVCLLVVKWCFVFPAMGFFPPLQQALTIGCLAAMESWKSELFISTKNISCASLIQVIFENGLPVKWRVHIFEPVRARGTKGEFRFVFFQRNLQLSWWDVWTMEIRLIFFWKGSMTNHSWIAYCVSFRQFLLLVSNYISNSSSLGPTSNAKMTMGYSRSPCSPA